MLLKDRVQIFDEIKNAEIIILLQLIFKKNNVEKCFLKTAVVFAFRFVRNGSPPAHTRSRRATIRQWAHFWRRRSWMEEPFLVFTSFKRSTWGQFTRMQTKSWRLIYSLIFDDTPHVEQRCLLNILLALDEDASQRKHSKLLCTYVHGTHREP